MADNFKYVEPGSGTDFAADDIGGVKYQRTKIVLGADGTNDGDLSSANPLPVTFSGGYGERSDTFTTAVAGTAIDASSAPLKYLAIQVSQTGTVTSWSVDLEGSLDGTTYTTLATHTKAGDGNGKTHWVPQPTPVRYLRSHVTALTLGGGTNIVVRILGMN